MESKRYPKVLVVGQTFNHKYGGGITMSNLFKGWPKDRLALASSTYLFNDVDLSVCEKYYQLGYNGKLHPFPFNLFLPEIICGPVNHTVKQTTPDQKNQIKPGKYRSVYNLIRELLIFLGLYNVLYRLKVTAEFKDWLVAYSPDIIYAQLETLELIRLVKEIHLLTNKPIAIHIMDDWPSSINKPSILFNFWNKKIDLEFRDLLHRASVLMSISQAMTEEYQKRYGKHFFPFRNPIEVEKWLPFSRTQNMIDGDFRILYTGRVGLANGKAILEIAKVIDTLNSDGIKVLLDIFTPDNNSKGAISLKKYRGVTINGHISHERMPELIASYDLLILPLDFDRDGIRFTRFSIPTKLSEYMISGVPILIYADSKTALAKYALNAGCAYVVTNNDSETLKSAVKELFLNSSLRKQLAEKAKKVVLQNDNAEIVKENFRKCLTID
jgi:glycosyltransferase involved in cell wall biosynthesis